MCEEIIEKPINIVCYNIQIYLVKSMLTFRVKNKIDMSTGVT